ncbi:MAG: glycosyltransferase family 4 protein [Desulfovibrio sp.]|nr:glycosyltransferase family 4 protein [Desulfovibrio sp.]
MRILVLSHTATPHTVRPVEHLLRQGHEVVMVGAQNPWPEGRAGFAHVLRQGAFTGLPRLLRDIGRLFAPHVVHVHYAWLEVLYSVQAHIAPVVVSVWGSDINDFVSLTPRGCAWRPFMPRRLDLRRAFPGVARVIIDDATMFDKCRFIAPDCAPIELLHLGVDTRQFRPPTGEERAQARARLGFAPEDVVLFSPRVMSRAYNQATILRCFAAAAAQNSRARLILKTYIPGGSRADSDYAQKLARAAAALPCSQQIRFVPPVPSEELHTLYWASDGVINYPQEDGFPVTLAEAAATCTPIITTMLPAYAGTFAEKDAFRIITDAGSLTSALTAFLHSPALPEAQLRDARDAVLRAYDFDNYTQRLSCIYQEIVCEHPHDACQPSSAANKTASTVAAEMSHETSSKMSLRQTWVDGIKKLVPARIKMAVHLHQALTGGTYEKIS